MYETQVELEALEMDEIRRHIKTYEDFPKKGIHFKDITPLIANSELFRSTIYKMVRQNNITPDYYVAVDARGFIFAAPMSATAITKGGLLLCRKKGKLPGECVERSYNLEYGTATLTLQKGVSKPGDKVIVVDDILVTGGTALCACQLCQDLGLHVEAVSVFMEIGSEGRNVLESKGFTVHSIIQT